VVLGPILRSPLGRRRLPVPALGLVWLDRPAGRAQYRARVAEHLFDELKRYVGFGEPDEALLRALGPSLRPHFGRSVEDFYEHIRRHPEARRAISGGEAQVERLKASLRDWLQECFEGPWDTTYFDRHARVGRRHVLIQLPQHYMFVAMSVIREQLVNVILADSATLQAAAPRVAALNRVLDLELAIMLHAYREASHAELIDAKVVAETATRTKSDFLANMSHEIRTPMNAIIGLAHLALKTQLTPKQRDYVSKIHGAGTSLLGIINDILDMSKIEAGRLDVEETELDLESVLASVSTVVGQKAHDKGLELLVSLGLDVPTQLLGDPLRLGQIVTNLLNNAIKFTEQGEVRLGVALLEQTGGKVKLRFTIEDTGIGMTPEQGARLFQPFVQADASTTRKHGGTGLGLSICKRLVELMGGEIGFDSALGRGTSFQFTVWLGVASVERHRARQPEQLAHLRVLVADDNAAAREIMSDALRDMVAQVDLVASGPEAVAAVKQNDASEPYHVVFMDWRMPGLDGLSAALQLKTSESIRNQPRIIIVTAFGREELREEAERLPVDGLLLKPVTRSMLADALVSVFAPSQEDGREAGAHPAERSLEGARFLLVEDNEINQQIAVELLEHAGARVQVAENGRLALEALQAAPEAAFHVVLMDLQMPEMDGHEATRRIRALPRFAGLPIVAMTAHATLDERQRCLDEGMADHISKPIDPEILLRTLRRYYTAAPGQYEAPAPAKGAVAELGPIPGLDVSDGLRRVAGNHALYRKLLRRFEVEQREAAARLREQLATGDRESALRLAHTLKGVAGNLGAKGVQESAAALEAALGAKAATPLEQLEPLVAVLEQRLAALIPLLAEALSRSEPPASPADPVDPARARASLAQLRAQLAEFDAAAAETAEAERAALESLLGAELLAGVERALQQYDFDAALALLDGAAPAAHEPP
jgi:two-component system, sensor histidine kinase and response regulator